MKGFKDTTKTQMGHGSYDEAPTRPATSKDVAAAKAVRIVTPSKPAAKPQPRVTDAMLRGDNEDKAPGERGAKRFAVGGVVPPVASGGMPAQGKPITNMNVNDARTAPPMQNGQRPMINRPPQRPAPTPAVDKGGLPQAWRDNYAADRASRLGGQSYDPIKSVPKPAAPYNAGDKVPNSFGPGDPRNPAQVAVPIKAYKRGGKVVEKGSNEVYASKAAMKKHEAKESKSEQRAERKQEGGELLAGRAQSLRDMVGKPSARAGYAKGGSVDKVDKRPKAKDIDWVNADYPRTMEKQYFTSLNMSRRDAPSYAEPLKGSRVRGDGTLVPNADSRPSMGDIDAMMRNSKTDAGRKAMLKNWAENKALQSLRQDDVASGRKKSPDAKPGYAQGGKPKSKWS